MLDLPLGALFLVHFENHFAEQLSSADVVKSKHVSWTTCRMYPTLMLENFQDFYFDCYFDSLLAQVQKQRIFQCSAASQVV